MRLFLGIFLLQIVKNILNQRLLDVVNRCAPLLDNMFAAVQTLEFDFFILGGIAALHESDRGSAENLADIHLTNNIRNKGSNMYVLVFMVRFRNEHFNEVVKHSFLYYLPREFFIHPVWLPNSVLNILNNSASHGVKVRNCTHQVVGNVEHLFQGVIPTLQNQHNYTPHIVVNQLFLFCI